MSADLAAEALAATLGGRPLRTYPALLSTESDALAWARAGAPDGAIVVADYQASPRGRGGLVWQVAPGRDLAFSLVLRPQLSVEREGWLYTLITAALADACGADASIAWPDEVRRGERRAAAVGVRAEPGPSAVEWAVATVLVVDPGGPRGAVLARLLKALDERRRQPAADTLVAHRSRCATIGRRVSAQLVPLGPRSARVTGTAATTLKDGALVIETDEGRRIAVRPQAVGVLEHVGTGAARGAGDERTKPALRIRSEH